MTSHTLFLNLIIVIAVKQELEDESGVFFTNSSDSSNSNPEKDTVLCHCPKNDCRGFITKTGKCGLCQTVTCTKCYQEKLTDHECNPDDVATAKLLKKDCRNCPNCKVLIHRYVGCPQMFCTNCHTGFDWGTGQILKKLHNPHLTEWLMTNGNQGGPCGTLNLNTIANRLNNSQHDYLRHVWNKAEHFHNREMLRLRDDFIYEYENLREQYLMKRVSEDQWTNDIKLLQRKELKNNEISQVMEMYYDATMNLLRQFDIDKSMPWTSTENSLKQLAVLVNTKFITLEKRFKMKCSRYKV